MHDICDMKTANAPLTLFLSYIRGPIEFDDYWSCRCSCSGSGYSVHRDADLLECEACPEATKGKCN